MTGIRLSVTPADENPCFRTAGFCTPPCSSQALERHGKSRRLRRPENRIAHDVVAFEVRTGHLPPEQPACPTGSTPGPMPRLHPSPGPYPDPDAVQVDPRALDEASRLEHRRGSPRFAERAAVSRKPIDARDPLGGCQERFPRLGSHLSRRSAGSGLHRRWPEDTAAVAEHR